MSQKGSNTWRHKLEHEIHDLCQPITTLQCRLELAQISGDEPDIRSAIEGGLEDCLAIFACVASLREHMQVGEGLR